MKRTCVVGHFGLGKNLLNGQTIKTKILTSELEEKFGLKQVVKLDTHGGLKAIPYILFGMIKAFRECQNIIILPGQNGIYFLVPICCVLNRIYNRRLHYVVIGGWLNDLINKNRKIEKKLEKFTGIYVETLAMKKMLTNRGIENVEVMPNFKNFKIIKEKELIYTESEPYKICTFSRVMKEKGIREAVEAVKVVNEQIGRTVYILDIYGQVDNEQEIWFKKYRKTFPKYVRYRGVVPYNKSVDILKDYYALLFPTYYAGEGFAGTLLDAMAGGVPVIASDWNYNKEVVIEGVTGTLIKPKSIEELVDKLFWIWKNRDSWNKLKTCCIKASGQYTPKKVISVLVKKMI